jgi:aminoglycoside phosphotransferase
MVLIDSLPAELRRLIGDSDLEENRIGWSGVRIFHVAGQGYLKVASDRHDLRPERDRLIWLAGRLPVPRPLYYGEHDSHQFLLISEIPGLPSFDDSLRDRTSQVITLLAGGLKMIHSLDVTGCPFDQGIDTLLETAHHNLLNSRVDENDFDVPRRGRTALGLYDELTATRPPQEDALVFVHGDYCLPNILIDPGRMTITGFIDWGSAGVSDRYFDLALAARSITYNLGAEWVAPFFAAYGLTKIDRARIAFFQLLDEFF